MSQSSESHHAEREHFFGAAKKVAGVTVVSRVLGMVRDMAIASLGADAQTGAFVLAYTVPNLFRRLFGEGALAGAFVPVFTETAERGGAPAAGRLFANALGLLTALLMVLTVLIELGLLAWWLISPAGHERAFLLTLTAIMLPFMVFICLLALASSVLNCRGHFAYPAFAPIIQNVIMIGAAWGLAPLLFIPTEPQLVVIALSVSVAGVAQVAGALWLVRRGGDPVAPRLTPVEPGVRSMAVLMLPTVLGLGIPQISVLFERIVIRLFSATPGHPTLHVFGREFALPLLEGAQMHVYAALQLAQFPMGVLATSLGVGVFPLLSRYAVRQDWPNFTGALNRAVRLALMEGLAAGTGLFLLAEPITRLIYRHRRFTDADAQETAGILAAYVLGTWAMCLYLILSKVFFALKEPRRPLKTLGVMAVLNLLLASALAWAPGVGAKAFGLATATTMSLTVIVLMAMLRRRLGPLGGRRILASVTRSLIACAVMGVVVAALKQLLTGWCIRAAIFGLRIHVSDLWLIVGAGVPAGVATFVLAAWALRAPELGELLGRKEPAPPAPV